MAGTWAESWRGDCAAVWCAALAAAWPQRGGPPPLWTPRSPCRSARHLANVQCVDRIVVLRYSRVVAAGTQAQLLAADGLYAHLAALQFSDAGR